MIGTRGRMFVLVVGGLFFTALCLNHAAAQVKLGAVGDSLVDEHFDQGIGYSKNWYELMVDAGKIDAGVLAQSTSSNWGDTRRTGYEYNFAYAGADTAGLIAGQQHTGLATIAPGAGITRAVVVIGANDFYPDPSSGTLLPSCNYDAIYRGIATQEQIDAATDQAIQAVTLAVQTLQAADMKVVVATVPDYGIAPHTTTLYPVAGQRELVTNVIRDVNARRATEIANTLDVPLVDIFSLTKDVWGENGSENAVFDLGEVSIDLDGVAASSATDADTDAAFADDGIHPMNSIGGVFANVFMTAFNQHYGDNFTLFTETEILTNAGPILASGYDGTTTLEEALGNPLSAYVIEPVPEPSTAVLLVFAVVGLTGLRRRGR
jgi:hypothetical protein